MPNRKAPLKARRAFLRQGKPLPAKSRKAAERAAERAEVRAATHKRANGHCEAVDRLPGVECGGELDTHEVLSRARSGGTSQFDPTLTMLACRRHHDHITANPAESERLGFLLPSRPSPKSRLLTEDL